MPLLLRECRECANRYTLLSMGGVITNNDRDTDIEDLSCPDCGCPDADAVLAPAVLKDAVNGSGIGIRFPYYDRALACEVQSAAHRRQLLRERGWVATDGDHDWEGDASRALSAAAAREAEMAADEDEMMNGPAKAEYRKALDVIKELPQDYFDRRG